MILLTVALIQDQLNEKLILLLSYLIFDNILVSYSAKKKNQYYCINF